MKKILSFVFSLLMFLSISAPALADSLDTKPSDAEIYRYLIDAGYSEEFIEALDDELRLEYYNGQYQFESVGTTRGIFTEDHKVEFSVDDSGKIVIDEQNLRNLEAFLNDKDSVERVLTCKEEADETFALSSATGDAVLSADDVDDINTNAIINAVEIGEIPIEIMKLTNWYGSIICSHVSYNKKTNVVTKKLTYTWKWSYDPTWELTDKVAMAWSGDFAAEPSTIHWTYYSRYRYFTGTENAYTGRGYGYDQYTANTGIDKSIDIRTPPLTSTTLYHRGTLSTTLTKVAKQEDRQSAVGSYFHKEILADIVLKLSKKPDVTVSTYAGVYDRAPDSAVAFWTKKG